MTTAGRNAAAVALLAALPFAPAEALAADATPSIVGYGFDGFWTGAQIGLASGFLATGREYESEEWRKLVFGAGVGALVGVGVGISLGVLDVGTEPPPVGGLILRDVGYGVGLGAVVGTAVGALFLIDDGRTKDLLTGASIGTIAGAGAGLIFGLIESAAASREPDPEVKVTGDVAFTLIGAEGSYLPLPAVRGSF